MLPNVFIALPAGKVLEATGLKHKSSEYSNFDTNIIIKKEIN